MKIKTIGIDLAKDVFQVHGVDGCGNVVLRKKLTRSQLLTFFANTSPCLIGMEACGGAHYWARALQAQGHTVKLMAPQFVKPYVKSNKNDARDAEAICEAVTRPNRRFVAIKTEEQQAMLAVHRVRHGLIKARTAQGNQIRGLLSEFGIVLPKGISTLLSRLESVLKSKQLPDAMQSLIGKLQDSLKELDQQVAVLERDIQLACRANPACQRLMAIPGVGPISASALIATIGDVNHFRNGRELAAFIGLVPRQCSSGGKNTLLGISKRGDRYLRTLLIHGAQAVLRYAQPEESWLGRMLERRHKNVVAVALANKNARTLWALLKYPERQFSRDYTQASACM